MSINHVTEALVIQMAIIENKIVYCINARPYIYSDWMVPIKHLVKMLLPSCNVARCAQIMLAYLKVKLVFGKSEQLALLKDKGLIQLMHPAETPMAMLEEIEEILPQLKKFVVMDDDELLQYKLRCRAFKVMSDGDWPDAWQSQGPEELLK
ncbi:hypothetical protein QTP88_028429 [Uroleucon formosanum]